MAAITTIPRLLVLSLNQAKKKTTARDINGPTEQSAFASIRSNPKDLIQINYKVLVTELGKRT